jgi:hypothetical protein
VLATLDLPKSFTEFLTQSTEPYILFIRPVGGGLEFGEEVEITERTIVNP